MDYHRQNTATICLAVLRDLIYKVERKLESNGDPFQLLWSDLQLPFHNLRPLLGDDHSTQIILVENKEAQVPSPETAAAKSEVKREIGDKFKKTLANTVTILERLDTIQVANNAAILERLYTNQVAIIDHLGKLLTQVGVLMQRLDHFSETKTVLASTAGNGHGGQQEVADILVNTRAPLAAIDSNKDRPTECHFSMIELSHPAVKRELYSSYDAKDDGDEDDENKKPKFKKVKIRVGLSKRRK